MYYKLQLLLLNTHILILSLYLLCQPILLILFHINRFHLFFYLDKVQMLLNVRSPAFMRCPTTSDTFSKEMVCMVSIYCRNVDLWTFQ